MGAVEYNNTSDDEFSVSQPQPIAMSMYDRSHMHRRRYMYVMVAEMAESEA